MGPMPYVSFHHHQRKAATMESVCVCVFSTQLQAGLPSIRRFRVVSLRFRLTSSDHQSLGFILEQLSLLQAGNVIIWLIVFFW